MPFLYRLDASDSYKYQYFLDGIASQKPRAWNWKADRESSPSSGLFFFLPQVHPFWPCLDPSHIPCFLADPLFHEFD